MTCDSDIAERVVDHTVRAGSIDSNRSRSDAGMFAEPMNVLNWIGSEFLPPVTAELSGRDAVDDGSDGEETASSDTIQKMRDYLTDNTTFEWLKQRVQAIMSTSGSGDVSQVSKKLLGILKQGFAVANEMSFEYTIDWDPREFMQCNYTGHVDIASVISINFDGEVYEACTVGDYLTRVWPVTGPQFLQVLRYWWIQISNESEENPIRRMLAHRPYPILD